MVYPGFMTSTADIAIFSDLDGTLLDHDSYDWAPARPLLMALTEVGVPVVLTSSKTAAELVPLRAAMGLGQWPAICENGAGIVAPGSDTLPDPAPRQRILAALETVSPPLRAQFVGFHDMGPARIATETGLPRAEAELAAQRAFSEPGLWLGTEDEKTAFLQALAPHGVTAHQGGRFLTLGTGGNKAKAMRNVADDLGAATAIALGDAPNDLEMIEAATIGIIIPNPHRPPLRPCAGEAEGSVLRADRPGPEGWSRTLIHVLSRQGLELGTRING